MFNNQCVELRVSVGFRCGVSVMRDRKLSVVNLESIDVDLCDFVDSSSRSLVSTRPFVVCFDC